MARFYAVLALEVDQSAEFSRYNSQTGYLTDLGLIKEINSGI